VERGRLLAKIQRGVDAREDVAAGLLRALLRLVERDVGVDLRQVEALGFGETGVALRQAVFEVVAEGFGRIGRNDRDGRFFDAVT
jgi:hypothetical protein